MEPRDVVRISLFVTFGALALAVAAWLLNLGLRGGEGGGALGGLVFIAGVVVLLGALLLLGGAGADAVWSRLERLRGR